MFTDYAGVGHAAARVNSEVNSELVQSARYDALRWTNANTVGVWTAEQLRAKMVSHGGEQS